MVREKPPTTTLSDLTFKSKPFKKWKLTTSSLVNPLILLESKIQDLDDHFISSLPLKL